MSDLDRLANAWEAQRGRRERARAAWLAGVRPEPDLARLAEREPALADPEAFLIAREAFASAPEARKPALGRLAAGMAEWFAFVQSAAAESQALASLSSATVRLEAESLLLCDAEVEVASCTDPARRRAMARAIVDSRGGCEPPQGEVMHRRLEAVSSLELLTPTAWGALWSVDLVALASAAEALLRDSEGPYLEALDFRLRRERLSTSAGGASRAELDLTLELTSLREQVSPGPADFAVSGCAAEMGLEARDGRRVAIDVEPRLGRFRGSVASPFAIPGEVAAVVTPLGTPGDLDRRLATLGAAWHWAGIDAELPISERVALDPALVIASGGVLASPLATSAWHRRWLRLPSRVADEVARAFALRQLGTLRSAAARFRVSAELRARGPSPSVRDAYRERLGRALGGDWGTVGWLDIDPLDPAAELRGLSIGMALGRELEDRFNDDWWRNPHAGEFLQHRWSLGGQLPTLVPDLNVAWRALAERAVG